MAFAQGVQAATNIRQLQQNNRTKKIELEEKEKEKRLKNAKTALVDITKQIVMAREGGVPAEKLMTLAKIPIEVFQKLIEVGDMPPGAMALAQQTLQNALNTKTNEQTRATEVEQKGDIATEQTQAKEDVFATTKLRPVINAEGVGQFATNEEILNSGGVLKPVLAGASGGSSAPERMSAKLLELETKALKTALTPEEELEVEILSQAVFGKRFSTRTTAAGDTVVIDSRGNARQVTREDGSPIVDINTIREDRLKRSAIAANQQGLVSEFNTIAGDSFDFVKDTQRVRMDSGRESVDDTALTFMFARTLPGVGKEIAQGDLERLSAIPGLPERIVAGFKSIITGRVLPDDVRESFKREIILHRSIKADNVRQTIHDLKLVALKTNTPDFIVPGLPEGSEFNPILITSEMTDEQIKEAVKPGKWFLDTDGVLFQRPKE